MSNTQIISFLRELANSLENNSLSLEKQQKISEFFMSYEITENINLSSTEYNTKDILKFCTMGWYIYFILNQKITSDEKLIEITPEDLD